MYCLQYVLQYVATVSPARRGYGTVCDVGRHAECWPLNKAGKASRDLVVRMARVSGDRSIAYLQARPVCGDTPVVGCAAGLLRRYVYLIHIEYVSVTRQAVNFVVVSNLIPEPGVAGTSCASPTAAGVLSLLNDLRFAQGKPR